MGRGRVTSPRTSRRLWEKCFRAVIVNVPTMLVTLHLFQKSFCGSAHTPHSKHFEEQNDLLSFQCC